MSRRYTIKGVRSERIISHPRLTPSNCLDKEHSFSTSCSLVLRKKWISCVIEEEENAFAVDEAKEAIGLWCQEDIR